MLDFLRGFLEETLNRKLRDEVKITYSLRVELATFAGQAYLGIVSEFQKEDIEVARFFIDQAVNQLRLGSMSESQFESIRRRTLYLHAYRDTTSDDLIQWVIKEFYQRPKYDEFPNLTLHHRTVSQERISQFVREHFHAKDSTIHITRPYPDELQSVLLLTFSLPGLGFLILRSRWKKSPLVSFPMTYQDVHLSWFNWVLMGIGAVTMILLGTSFGNEYLYEKGWHPDQVSSFYAKYVGLVFVYGTPSLLILGIMGSIPRRLYFFERGLSNRNPHRELFVRRI
ncbi:MAG TPA: hypothetical protein EYQ50_18920 [Verrucomicrobiales bacterium]|nr:hypothetical protein [Verrucomicrobiales bacterium]